MLPVWGKLEPGEGPDLVPSCSWSMARAGSRAGFVQILPPHWQDDPQRGQDSFYLRALTLHCWSKDSSLGFL